MHVSRKVACAVAIGVAVGLWLRSCETGQPPEPAVRALERPGDSAPRRESADLESNLAANQAPGQRSEADTDSVGAGAEPQPPAPDVPVGWGSFARPKLDRLAAVVFAPQAIELRDLARSVTFNPRDSIFGEDHLDRVRRVLEVNRPELQRLGLALQATQDLELRALIEAGAAIEFLPNSEISPLDAVGPGGICRINLGGGGFGARREQLPRSYAIEQELAALGRRMAAQLADVFHAAGALSEDECALLLQRLDGTEAKLRGWREER